MVPRQRVRELGQPDRVRSLGRHEPRRGEHHQVRVVNRHQRAREQDLGVLEVLVEHVDAYRGKRHHPECIAE